MGKAEAYRGASEVTKGREAKVEELPASEDGIGLGSIVVWELGGSVACGVPLVENGKEAWEE